jgi:predicted nucleic acid-binding protein
MKRAVVDASVVLKWYLLDEVDGEKALNLLEKHYRGGIELLAPSILSYEVANGLVIAGRRGRLAQEEVCEALEGYWALQLTVVDASRFFRQLPHFSNGYGISIYDASYAAVAELEKVPLITADEKLLGALKKDFRWLQSLQDLTA